MDELLRFLAEKGTEISPNAMIAIGFLYFIIWKDAKKRLAGVSAYIKRFLAIQNARRKATQDLAASIRALCRQVSGQECGDCREKCSTSSST